MRDVIGLAGVLAAGERDEGAALVAVIVEGDVLEDHRHRAFGHHEGIGEAADAEPLPGDAEEPGNAIDRDRLERGEIDARRRGRPQHAAILDPVDVVHLHHAGAVGRVAGRERERRTAGHAGEIERGAAAIKHRPVASRVMPLVNL